MSRLNHVRSCKLHLISSTNKMFPSTQIVRLVLYQFLTQRELHVTSFFLKLRGEFNFGPYRFSVIRTTLILTAVMYLVFRNWINLRPVLCGKVADRCSVHVWRLIFSYACRFVEFELLSPNYPVGRSFYERQEALLRLRLPLHPQSTCGHTFGVSM